MDRIDSNPSSMPVRLTGPDGISYEIGIHKVEDALDDLRTRALDRVCGARIPEDIIIKTQALEMLAETPSRPTQWIGLKKKVILLQTPDEGNDKYFTVAISQYGNARDGSLRTDLRLRRHGPQTTTMIDPISGMQVKTAGFAGMGFDDDCVLFIDTGVSRGALGDEGDKCDVRVNLAGREVEEAQSVFQSLVMAEIGTELTPGQAMLNTGSASVGTQMTDMFSFGLSPGQTIGRQFPSLIRYYDQLMSVGQGRGLREVDRPRVDLILEILKSGVRDDDWNTSRQINKRIEKKYTS